MWCRSIFRMIDLICTSIHFSRGYTPTTSSVLNPSFMMATAQCKSIQERWGSAEYDSVKNFIWSEINPDMRFIFAGNGVSPYQEREQWTDGCNLVAVKPGVAITYDRNPRTEVAFKMRVTTSSLPMIFLKSGRWCHQR